MSGSAQHPNIVIICSDQHRADTIGSYGSKVCRTPNLDRLADQGVRFDRCYANNPVCSPSRATIMTGTQSRRHRVMRNGIPCRTDLPTFADVLKQEGYRTAAVGKMHLTPHNQGVAQAPFYGFDELENSEDPKIGPFLDWALENYPEYEGYFLGTLFNLPTNDDYWKGKRDFREEVLPCREKHLKPIEISDTCNWGYGHFSPLPEEAHQTTWITNRAIARVEEHDGEQPLLLWVGYQDPHNPFDPPKRFREMYDPDEMASPVGTETDDAKLPPHLQAFRQAYSHFTDSDWRTLKALYYGSVTFMDEAIGRLVSSLESRLDMRNTVIIYTSDHGEILGDHGICGKWAYHYDSCIRVPLICRWDGQWQPGVTSEEITELVDLAPTLLAAAGAPCPSPSDGQSLLPILGGKETCERRSNAFIESFNGAPMDPTPPPTCWPRTIRTRRWRCTFFPQAEYGELYDLENDPCELDNLWFNPGMHDTIEEHRRMLADRLIMMDHPLEKRPYEV